MRLVYSISAVRWLLMVMATAYSNRCRSTSQATEIRFRTTAELIKNSAFYNREQRHRGLINAIAGPLLQGIRQCVTDGQRVSSWALFTVATALHRCVISVYPPVNGHQQLTTTMESSSFLQHNGSDIVIMWTMYRRSGLSDGTWILSHFVPLVMDEHDG